MKSQRPVAAIGFTSDLAISSGIDAGGVSALLFELGASEKSDSGSEGEASRISTAGSAIGVGTVVGGSAVVITSSLSLGVSAGSKSESSSSASVSLSSRSIRLARPYFAFFPGLSSAVPSAGRLPGQAPEPAGCKDLGVEVEESSINDGRRDGVEDGLDGKEVQELWRLRRWRI